MCFISETALPARMETGLTVGEVMTQRPVEIPANLTVRDAARIMRDKDVGSLLVTEGKRVLGIVTEWDIIHKVVAEAKSTDTVTVDEVMVRELLTMPPERDIYHALVLMRDNDIRHLPVLSKGDLVGFLTIKDVLKVQPQLFELLTDIIDLREEERKLSNMRSRFAEGFCEVCGNFSERLVRGSSHRLICPDCRE